MALFVGLQGTRFLNCNLPFVNFTKKSKKNKKKIKIKNEKSENPNKSKKISENSKEKFHDNPKIPPKHNKLKNVKNMFLKSFFI